MTTRRRRLLAPILIAVMGLSLLVGLNLGQQRHTGLPWNSAPPSVQAVMWPEPRPLDGFLLTTHTGHSFGPQALQGRWSFVFFGYLGCPDICPSSLHAMREMDRILAERNWSKLERQFIFVSVDPEHDRPEAIAAYLDWYQSSFIGLTGTAAEIAALATPMAVKFEEHIDDTGYRSIDHSSSLMMIDPQGRVVGALPPPLLPERMVQQFEMLQEFMSSRSL
jgi:protein SCO1